MSLLTGSGNAPRFGYPGASDRIASHWTIQPEPVEVPSAGPTTLVLAVRFAPWRPVLMRAFRQGSLLSVRLCGGAQLRQAEREQAEARPIFLVTGCVAALLMLLHVAFFYYNPARRANLYFAFYTGALGLAALDFYFSRRLNMANPDFFMGPPVTLYMYDCTSSSQSSRDCDCLLFDSIDLIVAIS